MKACIPTLLAFMTLSCAVTERSALYRLTYWHPPGSGADDYHMILNSVHYTRPDAFLAAVAKLPARSRLVWNTGCLGFDEIPLGPAPRMTLPTFKAFCRSHRIRFDYYCGLAADPFITKTFSVSRSLSPEITDARRWLQDRGVAFPKGSSVRWQPARLSLTVRDTQENIDLIGLLVQPAKSE